MPPTPTGPGVWRWGRWDELAPPRPTPTNPFEVRLLQFNMCGSACNEGDVGSLVDVLRDSILDFEPDVCLLNEACLAQIDRLWDRLDLSGFTTSACFGATSGHSRCPGRPAERWYGNAVMSRGVGIGRPERIQLPNPPRVKEQRGAVSMTAALRGVEATISSAHLVPGGRYTEFNRRQLAELARIQADRAATGKVVIFGGDFNATPDCLERFTGPEGAFVDVDHERPAATCGRRKIDYILVDAAHFCGLSASTVKTSVSDHRLLRGRATLDP